MDQRDHLAQAQATNAIPNYGILGKLGGPEPQRTFDNLSLALSRVRASRDQVEQMLDRVSPQPRDIQRGSEGAKIARQSYAMSLEHLQDELDGLGTALDQLEKHI